MVERRHVLAHMGDRQLRSRCPAALGVGDRMRPTLDLGALRKVKSWEYLLRFAFGGTITAGGGGIGHAHVAAVGGLVLALPAILPATPSLAAQPARRRR